MAFNIDCRVAAPTRENWTEFIEGGVNVEATEDALSDGGLSLLTNAQRVYLKIIVPMGGTNEQSSVLLTPEDLAVFAVLQAKLNSL